MVVQFFLTMTQFEIVKTLKSLPDLNISEVASLLKIPSHEVSAAQHTHLARAMTMYRKSKYWNFRGYKKKETQPIQA